MDEDSDSKEAKRRADKEGLKEEYRALRGEIAARIGIPPQIVSLNLATAGVFFAFRLDNALAIYVYPLLVFLLALTWMQNENDILQIATYIREKIEPHIPGLNWESSLQEIRHDTWRWRRTALAAPAGIFIFTQLMGIVMGMVVSKWSDLERVLLACDMVALLGVIIIVWYAGVAINKVNRSGQESHTELEEIDSEATPDQIVDAVELSASRETSINERHR